MAKVICAGRGTVPVQVGETTWGRLGICRFCGRPVRLLASGRISGNHGPNEQDYDEPARQEIVAATVSPQR